MKRSDLESTFFIEGHVEDVLDSVKALRVLPMSCFKNLDWEMSEYNSNHVIGGPNNDPVHMDIWGSFNLPKDARLLKRKGIMPVSKKEYISFRYKGRTYNIFEHKQKD